MNASNIPTIDRLPAYLRQYVTDQHYELYSKQDHAVWRFIMRQSKAYFRKHAHSKYVDGLKKTGIPVHRIPRIHEMDACLAEFGWGAVPVSGFIPPAAFLGFQAHSVLPIATQMRRVQNIAYTPAPDIVHEAAGHAPILADADYRAYLASYAEVAKKSILNEEDLQLYEAIRTLSDMKEDPSYTQEDIAKAEQSFEESKAAFLSVSEATKMSRMAWWTTEYGLLKEGGQLKIYGAGLLSSVGESQSCLGEDVEKRRLTKACVDQGYDITNHQPHLYVADSILHLHEVLDSFAEDLSYRRGGIYGLRLAQDSKLPATVVYGSGVALSGVVQSFSEDGSHLVLSGTVQVGVGIVDSVEGAESKVLTDLQLADVEFRQVSADFDVGGYESLGEGLFFKKTEGSFGSLVFFSSAESSLPVSVYGGPQDRESFGTQDVGQASTQPGVRHPMNDHELEVEEIYKDLREVRAQFLTKDIPKTELDLITFANRIMSVPQEWILVLELLELATWSGVQLDEFAQLQKTTEESLAENEVFLWKLGLAELAELDYDDQSI